MIYHHSVLVQLVGLVDRLPAPSPSMSAGRRGRLIVYSDILFLKALVVMIVRRLHKVGELLSVLEEPTQEMRSLRELLSGPDGRFPSRRTFERRLRALPETLPERIGLLGRHLVELLKSWARSGRAVALDSTVLRARGGVWHKKDKEAGGAAFVHRHRGGLDLLRLARVGLWLEAAPGMHRGRRVDTAGCSPYSGQRPRRPYRPALDRGLARGGAFRARGQTLRRQRPQGKVPRRRTVSGEPQARCLPTHRRGG